MEKSKSNKGTKKKWIVGGAIALTAVLVSSFVVVPQLTLRNAQAADSSVSTATAELGNIEVSVEGSGSLSTGGTVELNIPSGLELSEVLVEAGDSVLAGDTLATLSANSIETEIQNAQQQINAIDTQINDLDDTETDTVDAPLSGRVKQINIQDGSDMQSIVEKNGAIILLSLDGKMKVEFASTADLAAGDSVVITLSDDNTKAGTITSVGDTCTATLTDNGPLIGDSVSIADEDGNALGSGTLEINQPLNVLGSGVAADIEVSENEYVDTGDALVTLTTSAKTQEYENLLLLRTEYEALLQKLYTYKQTSSIKASQDGVIAEVLLSASSNGTSSSSNSSETQGTGTTPTTNTAKESAVKISLLSIKSENTEIPEQPEQPEAEPTDQPTPEPTPDEPTGEVTAISGNLELTINQPVTGNTPQSSVMQNAGYTGSVSWQPQTQKFEQQTAYSAMVTLKANAGYRFAEDAQASVAGAQVSGIAVSSEAQQNTLSFVASFQPTAASSQNTQNSQSMTGGTTSTAMASSSSGGSSAGVSSASSGSSSSTASTSSTSTSTIASPEEQSVFTMQTGSANTLTISVDELDILSIQTGQEASVVLDALPDESFTGSVTKISSTGTSQSGVTTYPVSINISNADSRLLEGMNATATIVTDIAENVLIIPMDALLELGTDKFVTVAADSSQAIPVDSEESEQALGERRTVETGLSDGLNVEITSGLEEGETITYTQKSSESSTESMMMGGGMAMSGSRMEPPSGGGGGTPPQ